MGPMGPRALGPHVNITVTVMVLLKNSLTFSNLGMAASSCMAAYGPYGPQGPWTMGPMGPRGLGPIFFLTYICLMHLSVYFVIYLIYV